MIRLTRGMALAFGVVLVGCQDLTVENLNAPDKQAVITNPRDVETLIYSAYRTWWFYSQDTDPNRAYSTLGNETTTGLQGGAFDVLREPREELPNFVEYFGFALYRDPWDFRWQVISTAFDGIDALRDGSLRIKEGTGTSTVDVTNRAQAFAYFLAGLGYVYLGFHFDQAYKFTEDMSLPQNADFRALDKVGLALRPYPEVAAYGRELLTKALAIVPEMQKPLPAAWTNSVDIAPADFARIIHSFIARSLVYTARTPAERAAVDWNEVLTHLDQGIKTDFYANYVTTTWTSLYKEYAEYPTAARVNNRLFGPADTAGAYQDWLAAPVGQRQRFQVRTPDRRITGNTPTSNGSYFGYSSGAMTGASTYGEYLNSYYRSIKFGGGVLYRNIPMVTMSVLEMDFLRAEAYYRLGRKSEAADIVNKTRTKSQTIGTTVHPGLPAVTTAGVPVSTRCVPRKPFRLANGTIPCGDLWDALMYEKRLETYGIEGIIPFADARGWGQLVEGSPLHFPIPARELEVIGKPFYSFGGVGRPGSAPAPTTVSP